MSDLKEIRVPVSYCRTILRRAGNGRVSRDAISAFREALNDFAGKAAQTARMKATEGKVMHEEHVAEAFTENTK